MSSRLFQEIREARGLAYSVFSYNAAFDDTGFFAIYAGTAPEHVAETLALIDAELDRLVEEGLSDAEIAAAKGHLVGSLAMSLETSASRMRRLGRSELVEGDIPSLDELIARVEAVTANDVARVDRPGVRRRAPDPRSRRPPFGVGVHRFRISECFPAPGPGDVLG